MKQSSKIVLETSGDNVGRWIWFDIDEETGAKSVMDILEFPMEDAMHYINSHGPIILRDVHFASSCNYDDLPDDLKLWWDLQERNERIQNIADAMAEVQETKDHLTKAEEYLASLLAKGV
jgi:hypothetical protein